MIILNNISKSYGIKVLFKNASYNMPENGRIALIGNNGEGKTSLLNILCGFDKDYDGEVIMPKRVKLGYLPQIVNPNPKPTLIREALEGAKELNSVIAMREEILNRIMEGTQSDEDLNKYDYLEDRFNTLNGYRIREDAKDILVGLGFKEDQMEQPVDSLSGGWRMRIEFAKMLLDNPNFLILDEPTNHLDLPSIEWFEGYLKKFQGTILFVSHDKDLLNRLSTHVLHLKGGKLTPYVGNFDKFLDSFTLKQDQNSHAAKHLKQQYEHIEKFVNRFRARPTKARQVQSRLKTLAKIRAMEDSIEFDEMKDTMNLKLGNPHPSGKHVLKLDKVYVGYEKPILKPLSFSIERGQKIAILGMNGLGKSTILKTIIGKIKSLGGEINWGHKVSYGYFAQEHLEGLNEQESILKNVMDSISSIKEVEARSLLGALGLKGDEVLKKISVLSGGEKSRTALACMLAKKPNVLLLDEPTNHLDLSACENLAEALDEYTGTVIFVSHNRAFINGLASHQLYLRQGDLVRLEEIDE